MAEHKGNEADDVFEFLESLPQTKDAGTKEPKVNTGDSTAAKDGKGKIKGKGGKNDEDILDFLDELEKSNLSLNKKNQPSEKYSESAKEKEVIKDNTETGPEKKEEEVRETAEPTEHSESDIPLNDPITSLSNWWSSSGSAAVSNIWNKTTEQASHIKTRLANEQLDITSRLNAARITELARNLQKMVAGETDEVLRIHLVHDLINFSSLQYNVEQKFDQVLSSQVQGGIRIFVDQWGNPNKLKDASESLTPAGSQRKLNIFNGKITDGEKLAFANLDNAIKLFDKAHEQYLKQQKEITEKEQDGDEGKISKDRISDIFISILPIAIPSSKHASSVDDIPTTDPVHAGNFSFTIILKDITNDITTITRSQGFPMKWVGWLEGDSEWKTKQEKEQEQKQNEQQSENVKPKEGKDDALPEEEDDDDDDDDDDEEEDDDGEIDPSDWVREWVEDGLYLSFGVAAQNYVIERMGF